jgi:hypothetical protein
MKRKSYSRRKRTATKSVLGLPDLEHGKVAVLNSLTSLDLQRGYRHAIDEFVDWYCSEPRLALNRIVVLRYRFVPRIPATCTWHGQPRSRCRAPARIRGRRLRSPQRRFGGWYSPC